MASSGSFQTSETTAAGGKGSGYMYAIEVSWQVVSQNIANNTSSIKCIVKPVGNNKNSFVYCGPIKVYLNGNEIVNFSNRIPIANIDANPAYGGQPWQPEKTFSVIHDANGNANITGWAEAAIYSSSINSTKYNYSSALPQIARASTISASSNTLGNTVGININRSSSSFTHTLKWYFGNKSGTIISNTSKTYVPWPTTLDMANAIPSNPSATCKIICETWNGGQKIGEYPYNITLSVPSNIMPSISSFTPSIASTKPAGCGLYVKNNSTVKWDVKCAGAYGSTIKRCEIAGQNLSYLTTTSSTSYSATSSTITTSGNLSYTVKITDTRDRTVSLTKTISVYDYAPPTIKSIVSFRSNPNGTQNGSGEYVTHRLSINFYTLNNKNNITVKVSRKQNTSSSFENQTTIPTSSYTISGSILTLTYTYPTTTFPISNAYNFRFIISDSTGQSITKDTYVGTKNVPINIAKDNNGVAIGGFAQSTTNGRFDCHWDAHFVSSPIVGSDRKLKDNIKNIDINIIDSLCPVKYNLKNGDMETTHYGFIAQDVEQALIDSGLQDNKPGLIHYDEDINTNEKTNYALSYEEFIPFLVKKCQELQQEVNELKNIIKTNQ